MDLSHHPGRLRSTAVRRKPSTEPGGFRARWLRLGAGRAVAAIAAVAVVALAVVGTPAPAGAQTVPTVAGSMADIVPQPVLVQPNTAGLCLDDPGATTDGTQLQIYTCNGTPAQVWRLP
jgi:anti-sigma-K factor RskA